MRLRSDALLVLLASGCGGVAPATAPQQNASAPQRSAPQRSAPQRSAPQRSAPSLSSESNGANAETVGTEPAPPAAHRDFGGVERQRRSPAVEREEAHLEDMYAEVPLLQSLPDYLSLEAIARALPADWQEVRDGLQEWPGSDTTSELLRGGYLDSEERYYLVWIHRNLEQLALVFDRRGRRQHQQVFSRARPTFREVLALESPVDRKRGVTSQELVVFRITTMSVCCLPTDLEVYALAPTGRLRLILAVPKHHVDVGPGIRYEFLNHVEFLGPRVVVTQLVPESPLLWEFEYHNARGRFEPDAATVRSMKEQQLHH